MKKQVAKPQTEKGYSVKYALTQGIQTVTIDLTRDSQHNFVYTVAKVGEYRQQLRRGKTYFTVLDEAISAAKKVAERKVKSLKVKLAKMERLAAGPQLAFEVKRGS